jgi:hypothetical protein
MRARSAGLLLTIAAATATFVAACATTANLPFDASPVPTITGTPAAPTPTPVPAVSLTVAGTQTEVISSCFRIVSSSVAARTITLDAAAGPGVSAIVPGSRLLLMQVQDVLGAGAAYTNNTTPIPDIGSAGLWELAWVQTNFAGSVVQVDTMARSYTSQAPGNAAQACIATRFSSLGVDINGTIAAQAWDGTRGGIVVAVITSSLRINGTVSALGSGFRGGAKSGNGGNGGHVIGAVVGTNCKITVDTPSYYRNSHRAEGLAGFDEALPCGRGSFASGGGGGANFECGGGGGANAGAGGLGARAAVTIANGGCMGTGGAPLLANLGGPTAERLLFGGGGGGGHKNAAPATANGGGGPGGGAILFVCEGGACGFGGVTTGRITADGGPGTPNGLGEPSGAGGGGAGGTIVLLPAHFGATPNIVLTAAGGVGGMVKDITATAYPEHYGVGGGGGGGRISCPLCTLNAAAVQGGAAGSFTGTGSPATGTDTPGKPGDLGP